MWCDGDDAKNRAIYVAIRSYAISYEHMVAWVEGWEKTKQNFWKREAVFFLAFSSGIESGNKKAEDDFGVYRFNRFQKFMQWSWTYRQYEN